MPIHNTPTETDTDRHTNDESPVPVIETETKAEIETETGTATDPGTDTAATATSPVEATVDLETLCTHVKALEEMLEAQDERIESLEDEIEAKADRIDTLETRADRLEDTCEQLAQQLTDVETESAAQSNRIDAISKKSDTNKQRVAELQSRELEKGAHLHEAMVDKHAVDVPDGRLERLTKDDGRQYYRLPKQADPLDRTGDITLAYGDLLPIQQFARMDDDMLRSTANALPTRLAAKLWQARTDLSVGDNPWEPGGAGITEYVKASDLKHWIRRQEFGVSDTYAKKLVSRVIDAVLDLSIHRVAVRKRTERKNGLEYTERRLVIPKDVDIPGGTPGGE